MTYTGLIAASVGLAFALGVPASAQTGNRMMGSDHMNMGAMKLSKADMARLKQCHKLSHKAMMKSRSCAAMMKAHPEMMKHGTMAR